MGLYRGSDDKDYKGENESVAFPGEVWEGLLSSGVVHDVLQGLGFPGGWAWNIDKLVDDVNNGITTRTKTPSVEQFSKCNELKGVSVWDTRGLWRCLFPQSVVQNGGLSREAVEADKDHKLGLFFPEYSGFLSWRAHMMALAKQKRKEEREIYSLSTPEDVMLNQVDSLGKNVVGTSSYSTYKATPEGKERIKEEKTYYEDGTVLVKTKKKIYPHDGEPRVESSEKLLNTDESS
ncbi:Mpm1p [Kluyveromyces lactis]|uniref:KLLA0F01881p n=1 Tax=Kluyveromyces lactis (strain ATCC 8585 / CBS 2359 / DSM 70799 / NBRC 1267 / NRRL Y-1140 / WM37) TaxID=284590 RepID=Q6CLM4_KLULA|nr:uncharacterized protein KLLA0_F01881g [Kluyveromyces lactis]CAG97872.1 KLLA0F01881p [Kluyveromyces lactis]|eukprot:XP_455165.1 uncharacterized protein KLLA0_F01881g [Kluyveromyces lactis]